MTLNPRLNDPTSPLVSILIFNYNYGRYLRECFDSVLAQTYDNIEINFSDNASTDDSWEIALEYQRHYPDVFFVARNRRNFGAGANFMNTRINARGQYVVELCSDDALLPDYVRSCVVALESHLEAGFAMVHRAILDAQSTRTEEPPFYDQTCLIPGAAQTAVYMMAAVNASISQVMYRKTMMQENVSSWLASRLYGSRIKDFLICCEHPIIYIKEPLLLHRLHDDNDNLYAAHNLMEVIGPYVLNSQFTEVATSYGHISTAKRLAASVENQSRLSLRYATRALLAGDNRNAQRYLHLAMALWPEIDSDATYQMLNSCLNASHGDKPGYIETLRASNNLVTRVCSYSPPGSTAVSINELAIFSHKTIDG